MLHLLKPFVQLENKKRKASIVGFPFRSEGQAA